MRPFEHYLRAEELLEEARAYTTSEMEAADLRTEAQVHATLALVVEAPATRGNDSPRPNLFEQKAEKR